MTHEEICTCEVAKLAKEKGFSGNSFYVYNNDRILLGVKGVRCWDKVEFVAPTQSLLQRWLREEKGIHIIIDGSFQWGLEDLQRHFMDRDIQVGIGAFGLFDTYEEALHDALLYSLRNV